MNHYKFFYKISVIICLCLFGGTLFSQDKDEKNNMGESKDDIIARLKSNLLKDENGDVYIRPFQYLCVDDSKPTDGYPYGFYKYIDTGLDAEFFIEKYFKKAYDHWRESLPAFVAYFKDKGITFKHISENEKVFKSYLDKGIPICAFYLTQNKEAWGEFLNYIIERQNERKICSNPKKWEEYLRKQKNESKKVLTKLKVKGKSHHGFFYLTGYNDSTKEYQVFFNFQEDPLWITYDEFKAIPKYDRSDKEVTFRSFDF